LTLRPENTASVIRAYIEHRLDQQPGLKKLYYIGPMFRRERPQKGRFRQFFQIGAEAIGSTSPIIDAEVIEMVTVLLRECGLKDFHLVINSVGDPEDRQRYVVKLREALAPVKDRLSEDNRRRADTNPLRVLDSKEPEDEEIIAKLPSILDSLSPGSVEHFSTVRALLGDRGIPYEVRPRLVRGLDYYTHTTFEIVHGALGAQNSIMGGGRYNGLAEAIGSKVAAPGIGFSIGEDRLIMAVDETGGVSLEAGPKYLIAYVNGESQLEALRLAHDVRAKHRVEIALDSRLKKALELADKIHAEKVVIVGFEECFAGQYMVRDLRSGQQEKKTKADLLNG
jgi:histidyl-tRNA synthetase